MGRYASDTGSTGYTPAPVGTHVARCIRIIDLGTQHGEWNGKPTKRNQVLVVWELPHETVETQDGERPIEASRFYTNSLGERASLRQDLEAWRGRGFTETELQRFDLESVLGVPCMLTVIAKDNGKTKVDRVTGLPKNTTCPPQVNESFSFWLDEEFDYGKFESLSEGIQGIIKRSDEWKEIQDGHDMSGNREPQPRQRPPDDWDEENPPF